MFGGFQPDAFQPNVYQHADIDAFQCFVFQQGAFQNSCVAAPADAFQCFVFQQGAFQNNCVIDTPVSPFSGGWPGIRRKRPPEFTALPAHVQTTIERVARRQVVLGPDLDAIQRLQELRAELGYDKEHLLPEYVKYFTFIRKQLEEEKAVAMLMIMMLS